MGTTSNNEMENMFRKRGTNFKKEDFQTARKRKDPCWRERELSLGCLTENSAEQEKCKDYFVNVKNCMKFWSKVTMDRRMKGIHPELPPLEEREKVRAEYINEWKIPTRH